jgi:hypothetical protein
VLLATSLKAIDSTVGSVPDDLLLKHASGVAEIGELVSQHRNEDVLRGCDGWKWAQQTYRGAEVTETVT